MRGPIAVLLGLGGLLLGVSGAGAETYQVLQGRLESATGASEALEGMLEISVSELGGRTVRPSLQVDDFALRVGSLEFGPRQPVEFEHYPVLFLQIADQIQFDGDRVDFWYLRSGGEQVAVDEREVIFRFADFRAAASNAGELVGYLGDGGLLPRRLALVGTLSEVDQHFLIPTYDCPVVPLPPRDGGGILGGGGAIPGGGALEVPDPTSLSPETLRRIISRELALSLDAGEVVIGGDRRPADVKLDPLPLQVPVPFCGSLWATFPPEERELGQVTLVATAARPIGIEVEPRRGGRPRHARHGTVEVAILGSEELDVRDVDEHSLRLGPDEAEPSRHPGLGRTRRVDVNRDGERDLLVRFDAREAGISHAAATLCLWGETRDGSLIEGCASVAAGLERARRGRWGRPDAAD